MSTLAALLARDSARLAPRDQRAWATLRASAERTAGRHHARAGELERAWEAETARAGAAYDRMMAARRAVKEARIDLDRAKARALESRRTLHASETAWREAERRSLAAERLWKRVEARRVAAEAAEARRLERFWRRVAG